MSKKYEDQELRGMLWKHVSSLGNEEEHIIDLFYKHNTGMHIEHDAVVNVAAGPLTWLWVAYAKLS